MNDLMTSQRREKKYIDGMKTKACNQSSGRSGHQMEIFCITRATVPNSFSCFCSWYLLVVVYVLRNNKMLTYRLKKPRVI